MTGFISARASTGFPPAVAGVGFLGGPEWNPSVGTIDDFEYVDSVLNHPDYNGNDWELFTGDIVHVFTTTEQAFGGTRSLKVVANPASRSQVLTLALPSGDRGISCRFYDTGTALDQSAAVFGFRKSGPGDTIFTGWNTYASFTHYVTFDGISNQTHGARSVGWHHLTLRRTGTDYEMLIDGDVVRTFSSPIIYDQIFFMAFLDVGGGGAVAYYDDLEEE